MINNIYINIFYFIQLIFIIFFKIYNNFKLALIQC